MNKLKIAFFETEPWEEDYLRTRLSNFDLQFFADKLTVQDLKKIESIDILSPFIYSSINKKIVSALPSLKFIATRSTGFDHIDLKSLSGRKIALSNVPTYGENTVAEHTFALILDLSRKICFSGEKTRMGDFTLDNIRGFDLKDKTIGIIGLGNIGRHVARIANGFEMKVLVFDVKKDKNTAKKLHFQYAPLKFILKHSDIITLHLPYNKKTRHLINLKSLKLFKHGCYLINTARGGLCDTTALLKGLKDGVFAGLGLDVLEEESAIKEERQLLSANFQKTSNLKTILENHILINQPNVIITPHNAFNSREALTRILDTTIDNINAFSKKKLINLVR